MDYRPIISLGTILQIISSIVIATAAIVSLKGRLDVFAAMLRAHADSLQRHADRLDKHEERILDLVSGLQRLMGQAGLKVRRSDLP